MRLEAERERILKYKHVASQQTRLYYRLLEEFCQLLERAKEAPFGTSQSSLNELTPSKKLPDEFQLRAEQMRLQN
jgi:hypothetical protein